ncbi:WD40 repeat [Fusarium albosuccineum]|uniref:WD40 repeat n=1 Tax=Fusarium albosuccineum TaxID=1237068 RepID=A0A8H4L967_9HYPO|nr:WD40 repeat [Fusarium albosuccineum]
MSCCFKGIFWKKQSSRPNTHTKPEGLDGPYGTMLRQLKHKDAPQYAKDILRIVYVAFRPLTIQELPYLVEDRHLRQIKDLSHLETMFEEAGSFLTVDNDRITFVHPSARDLISKWGSHEYFAVLPSNIGEVHWEIFARSISNMSDLKKDIYGVVNPYTKKSDLKCPTPDPLAPLAYSCVHWADHLSLSACLDGARAQKMVCRFLSDYFLLWVEALGWLGELSAGIKQLDKLKSWVFGNFASNDLRIWIDKARRLLIKSRPGLEYAPLTVYTSALASPSSSSLIKNWDEADAPASATNTSKINQDWNALAITLEIPGPHVMEVIWNGNQRLSSIYLSTEGTKITSWDVDTGSGLHDLVMHGFSTHGRPIVSSKNGQKSACLAEHCIYVWDATTGDAKKFEFTSEDKTVHDPEISLSNTGQLLVAASRNYSVMMIWDTTNSGQDEYQADWRCTFPRSPPRTRVTFLTETVFASTSDNTIFIEDVNEGHKRMICLEDTILSIICSKDG